MESSVQARPVSVVVLSTKTGKPGSPGHNKHSNAAGHRGLTSVFLPSFSPSVAKFCLESLTEAKSPA